MGTTEHIWPSEGATTNNQGIYFVADEPERLALEVVDKSMAIQRDNDHLYIFDFLNDLWIDLTLAFDETDPVALPVIQNMEQSGLVSWDGTGNYYSAAGANFSVIRAGTGRLSGTKITWTGVGETVTLTAGKSYLIGYSATNTLVATDFATIFSSVTQTYHSNLETYMKTHVCLFQVWYDGIEMTVTKEDHEYDYPTEISVHDHFRLGHVYLSIGGIISVLSSANRTIQTIGEDLIDDHGLTTRIVDGTGVALSTDCFYQNAGGTASRLNRQAFTTAGFSVTPTAGAIYGNVDGGAGDTARITVLYVASNVVHGYRSFGTVAWGASGTLYKVSGTGDATKAYSSVATMRVIPSIYLAASVPTPLGSVGATRYGIFAVYALKDDKQTGSPSPKYICVPSSVAYVSASAAAASLGTGLSPTLTQFTVPTDIVGLEPCLTGFVLIDGNTRIIPTETSNGFVSGVRSFRSTSGSSGSAGAIAVASGVNVGLSTTDFNGILTTAETNAQLAMDRIDDYAAPLASPNFNTKVTFGNYYMNPSEVDDGDSSTADTIDWSLGSAHRSKATGNCTYTFSNPVIGGSYVLKVVNDGTVRTIAWPDTVLWGIKGAPTLTGTNLKVDLINFYWDGASYYGSYKLGF